MSPCDYTQYHPDWRWIRRQILDQADNRCEFCGLENGITVIRRDDGHVLELRTRFDMLACTAPDAYGGRCVRIVLTIAHLDHDTSNNEPSNLRALCQQCHLRWDAEHHQKNAAATRRTKRVLGGQLEMAVAS